MTLTPPTTTDPAEDLHSVSQWRRTAARKLETAGIRNAVKEADWLVLNVLGRQCHADLIVNGDRKLTHNQAANLEAMLHRRQYGEPLQYVLGSTEFYGLPLAVGPGAFIPRPETEVLVDIARRLAPGSRSMCDLCTGSGAVALALASTLAEVIEVIGTDSSSAALSWARKNKDMLDRDRVHFYEGSLFDPLPTDTSFDLVTANPPYVSTAAMAELPGEVRDYEPSAALFATDDGLAVIRQAAAESYARLEVGGFFLCEIGEEHGARVAGWLQRCGYSNIDVYRDYADRERIAAAQKTF